MSTKRGRRARRSEYVADRIVALIREQRLSPGDLLPSETRLMEELGVGRSSVREALRGLAVLGVVEIRQGQGTFVLSPSLIAGTDGAGVEAISSALARGVTDALLEARQVIEVRIASLAAQRATVEDRALLNQVITTQQAAIKAQRPSTQPSAEFHLAIARAAHNDVLEGFVASYVGLLAERGAVLERLPGYLEWEMKQHDGIRQAIEARAARLAAARMHSHLKDVAIYYDHLAAIGSRVGSLRTALASGGAHSGTWPVSGTGDRRM